MKRIPDWASKLNDAVDAARGRKFEWGRHDCAIFAADVVLAMTGDDFADGWRGTYSSAEEAVVVIHSLGGMGGLGAVATKFLGDPVRSSQAQRGDVVMRCGDLGPSLGICVGAMCVFTGHDGLVFVPLSDCEQAWHV